MPHFQKWLGRPDSNRRDFASKANKVTRLLLLPNKNYYLYNVSEENHGQNDQEVVEYPERRSVDRELVLFVERQIEVHPEPERNVHCDPSRQALSRGCPGMPHRVELLHIRGFQQSHCDNWCLINELRITIPLQGQLP